jgi:hypothetical protein
MLTVYINFIPEQWKTTCSLNYSAHVYKINKLVCEVQIYLSVFQMTLCVRMCVCVCVCVCVYVKLIQLLPSNIRES